jgi:hypothetical protein
METGFREMHGSTGADIVLSLESVDTVKPDSVRLAAIRLKIGEGCHFAAGIPFLAINGAGMTTDADIEINNKTEFLFGCRFGKTSHEVSPLILLP